jgi:hypothetical protein
MVSVTLFCPACTRNPAFMPSAGISSSILQGAAARLGCHEPDPYACCVSDVLSSVGLTAFFICPSRDDCPNWSPTCHACPCELYASGNVGDFALTLVLMAVAAAAVEWMSSSSSWNSFTNRLKGARGSCRMPCSSFGRASILSHLDQDLPLQVPLTMSSNFFPPWPYR